MSFINIKGKDARPVLMFLLGLLIIPLSFALSTVPAYLLSSHTEDARTVFYFPKDQPVWVSPWLYHFSMAMHCLTYVGMAMAVFGGAWMRWRRKHVTQPHA